jgi:hypothetical protein
MKRSPIRRKAPFRSQPLPKPERAAVLVVPAVAPKPRAVMALCGGASKPQPKAETHRGSDWLDAVRSLPNCVLCGASGVEPAHRNESKGMGSKTHHCWTAALCRDCHRGIDQGRTFTRDERRAEIDRAIVLTLAELVLAGKVAVVR